MQILMELLLLQILVVVAIIQMKYLKTEVGNGFMLTSFGHGLVDPKEQAYCVHCSLAAGIDREWG